MNHNTKFASLRIVTRDVPALARFYQEITQIVPVSYGPDYAEFSTPAGVLALGSKRSMDLYGAGAAQPGTNRSTIIEFQVDDVDAEYARLKSIVSDYELTPTTQPWGNRSMLFRDPDGNLINFFTPVSQLAILKYNA